MCGPGHQCCHVGGSPRLCRVVVSQSRVDLGANDAIESRGALHVCHSEHVPRPACSLVDLDPDFFDNRIDSVLCFARYKRCRGLECYQCNAAASLQRHAARFGVVCTNTSSIRLTRRKCVRETWGCNVVGHSRRFPRCSGSCRTKPIWYAPV